jgi:hypothetical protein
MLTVVRHKSGPWRSMSIFILNVPFAIEKRTFVFALSCRMNRRLVWQKTMRIKKTFILVTRQFVCAPNVQSMKRDAAQTRKKSANSNLFHN